MEVVDNVEGAACDAQLLCPGQLFCCINFFSRWERSSAQKNAVTNVGLPSRPSFQSARPALAFCIHHPASSLTGCFHLSRQVPTATGGPRGSRALANGFHCSNPSLARMMHQPKERTICFYTTLPAPNWCSQGKHQRPRQSS